MGFCLHGCPHLPIIGFQSFQRLILLLIRRLSPCIPQVDGDAMRVPNWLADRAPQAQQELHQLQVPHRGLDPDTAQYGRTLLVTLTEVLPNPALSVSVNCSVVVTKP